MKVNNNSNYPKVFVQVNTTHEQAEDIAQRICEVIKTEFGVEAFLLEVATSDDSDCEQDVIRMPVMEDIILLHYIGAYGDPVQTEEFCNYDDAKKAAENAIASRSNDANWYRLEIISSNGSQLLYWDGMTVYDFYVN